MTDGGNSFGSPIKLNQLNGIAQPTKDNGIKIRAFGNSVYIVWVEKFSSNDEVFFIKILMEEIVSAIKKSQSHCQ